MMILILISLSRTSLSYALNVNKTLASPIPLVDLMAHDVSVDEFFVRLGPLLRPIDFNHRQIPLRFIMNEEELVSIGEISGETLNTSSCILSLESLW